MKAAPRPGPPGASRRRSKVALVCAGGGVTGAVYEIGCLRALDELARPRACSTSTSTSASAAGAFVASLLAARRLRRARCTTRSRAAAATARWDAASAPLFRLGAARVPAPRRPRARGAGAGAAHEPAGGGRNLSRPGLVAFRAAAPGPARPPPGSRSTSQRVLPGAARRRPLRRPAARRCYVVAVDLDSGEAVAFGEPRPPRRARLEGGPGLDRAARALPAGADRRARLRRRRRAEDRPHQPRDPERGRPGHLHQPDRPDPERHRARRAARPPEQPRRDLRARPGDAHHAPRAHAVRARALPRASTPRWTSC